MWSEKYDEYYDGRRKADDGDVESDEEQDVYVDITNMSDAELEEWIVDG